MSTPDLGHAPAFAFITYVGELLTSPPPLISQQEGELLGIALHELGLGDWRVVWGPALYRFPHAKLYDNFIFVAGRGDEYVVAVRGTNGHATLDWIFEDFWVIPQYDWTDVIKAPIPGEHAPRVSHATQLGLGKLLGAPAVEGLPGAGKHLVDFLRDELSGKNGAQVTVTGHSLGGALAPTLALYLNDTRGRSDGWDPAEVAEVHSVAFAGPTAGNAAFARYTEQQMGSRAVRVVNPLDAVPLAWSHDGLEALKHLYDGLDHKVGLSFGKRLAIDAVIGGLDVIGADYEQYHQSGDGLVTLEGLTHHETKDFASQAGWQHVQGYESQLGIDGLRDTLDAIFARWCAEQPSGTCP